MLLGLLQTLMSTLAIEWSSEHVLPVCVWAVSYHCCVFYAIGCMLQMSQAFHATVSLTWLCWIEFPRCFQFYWVPSARWEVSSGTLLLVIITMGLLHVIISIGAMWPHFQSFDQLHFGVFWKRNWIFFIVEHDCHTCSESGFSSSWEFGLNKIEISFLHSILRRTLYRLFYFLFMDRCEVL